MNYYNGISQGYEELYKEEQIKKLIEREDVAPGKYYNPKTFSKLSKLNK